MHSPITVSDEEAKRCLASPCLLPSVSQTASISNQQKRFSVCSKNSEFADNLFTGKNQEIRLFDIEHGDC